MHSRKIDIVTFAGYTFVRNRKLPSPEKVGVIVKKEIEINSFENNRTGSEVEERPNQESNFSGHSINSNSMGDGSQNEPHDNQRVGKSKRRYSIGNIFRNSTHKFSHYVIMFMFLLVILVGAFSTPKGTEEITNNPFLAEKKDENVNEVSYVQSVATIATLVDDKLGAQAIEFAQKEETAPTLAVAGNGFLAAPVLAQPSTSLLKQKNDVREYIVQNGDTLWTIARSFDLTTDTLKWANSITDEDSVKPGQKLVIPPTVGVLYTVKSGDTLEGIANKFQSSVAIITSQNDLYGEDLKVGMKLMIPDGEMPDEPRPQAPAAPRIASGGTGTSGSSPQSVSYGRSSYNRFPYGYCTWYVASRRNIPWNGNAWQWYGNAIAYGNAVGKTPVPGAVMVTWESGVGHVALVESVNGSSFTVSEMNYRGWGVVSSRTITTSSVPLIGFIY